MSDKSQELLLGLSVEMPEMDSDEKEIDDMLENANLVSSIRDILDNMGKQDFRFVWAIQFEFIRNEPFYQHARFADQLLERVFEVYEYQFPEKLYFFTKEQVNRVYDFIKFLEYDNVEFITLICRMLKLDVIKENIKSYCEQNSMKIIKEVEEQLGTYQQPELISIFLRTYMRNDFINWFITQVKRSKMEIAEKQYEM